MNWAPLHLERSCPECAGSSCCQCSLAGPSPEHQCRARAILILLSPLKIRSRWGYFFLQQSKMSSAWTQFAVGVGVQKACAQMTSLSPTPLAKQNPAICETWPWWTACSAVVGGLILLFRAINFQLTYKVRTQEALVPKHDNVKCCWGSCWRNDTSPDVGCGGLPPHGVS